MSSKTIEVTELMGDGIGPELSQAIHQVAEALPLKFKFEQIDWSVENREAHGDKIVEEGCRSMLRTKLALKYPTETRTKSPNALLRRFCNFSVIYRPAISIKGISSNFKPDVNLHIVRVATGGTYDDPGRMIGDDGAVSLRIVERKPCEHAATFAFELAKKKGWKMTSSSKHTIQRGTDGLFESIVNETHKKYADVPHDIELFDALLAKIIIKPQNYRVVLVLNEYGDFLSDMASGLVGSIGTGASGNYGFDKEHKINVAMFDPSGGTAPDIAGKNLVNPAAIFLAMGMLLDHIDRYDLGHALRLSLLGCIERGECTGDIGGKMSCTQFTDAVIKHLPEHLPKK